MATGARLGLRQSQTLAMTPQLRQAIRLLQLSSLELSAYVAEALDQNPLLERVAPIDAGHRPDTGDAGDAFDGTPAPRANLADHLRDQLAFAALGADERAIGARLIEQLDEAGYLPEDPASLAALLDCDVAEIETVLVALRRFDPPGVFAHDLADCLALQLAEAGKLDAPMAALLDNLDLIAAHRTDELRRRCGVGAAHLADMLDRLRALDPKPGLAFEETEVLAVLPDVLVSRDARGDWRVELNDDALPRLLANRRYHATVKRQARTREDRAYLSERLSAANWLVRTLDQRADTILRVATEIVARQTAFFDHGIARLAPMVLRDVAAALDIHESTVSRATANKYMATPRGTLAMRFFFTSAVSSVGGAPRAHSSTAVRHHIEAAIDAEDDGDVLSDARLVGLLRSKGIDIARRTVAKYRDAMHIPPSTVRRRIKKPLR